MFVAKMCSKMAEDDVPHNVAFVRGKPLRHAPNSLSDSDEYPVRVYIWPRRPTLGSRVSFSSNISIGHTLWLILYGPYRIVQAINR